MGPAEPSPVTDGAANSSRSSEILEISVLRLISRSSADFHSGRQGTPAGVFYHRTRPAVLTRRTHIQAGVAAWAKLIACYRLMDRKRSALVTTETELKLIAAAAIIGLRSHPKTG